MYVFVYVLRGGVYVCIAFTADGEKGVLSLPKGLPPQRTLTMRPIET